jgi:uncharacterized protein (TIGR02246 family)
LEVLQMPSTATIGIDQEIQSVVEEFERAWNKHDYKALASIWKTDGDLINPFGRVAKGRSEVEKLLHDEHSGEMKNTSFRVTRQTHRSVGPDLVLVEWDMNITGVSTPQGTRNMEDLHCTSLLQKQGDRWYAVAVRPVAYIKR